MIGLFVHSIGYDWLGQLTETTSGGTGGTADVKDSAVVGASQCSATAVSVGTESMGVMTSTLGSTAPSKRAKIFKAFHR